MQILIGTTNPAKAERYRQMLSDYDVTFLTLKQLSIDSEPEETGRTPAENAVIKARHYGQFWDAVICADSGLYFPEALPMAHPLQPGLRARTPHGADHRLDDEEMIAHYAALARRLGAPVLACWSEGQATCNRGEVRTFQDSIEVMRASGFYLTDRPTPLRRKGYPLDSLSLRPQTMTYYLEEGAYRVDASAQVNPVIREYREALKRFFVEAFDLKKR